ncbi:hypothetical protein LOZ66_000729 [Ophidiomyces ophidiicola]|nr:hypothetical protein LOZ66_000729 [Ophidiomyces ophidiicola]
MPPRISLQSCPRSLNGPVCNLFAGLSLGPTTQTRAASSKRKHKDPFTVAAARQRKAANVSRQRVLQEERTARLGHPVTGILTPSTEALLNGQVLPISPRSETNEPAFPQPPENLNYFIFTDELNNALEYSKKISEPVPTPKGNTFDPEAAQEAIANHEEKHKIAKEAVERITRLSNGNSADRTRLNIQRCIAMFGRHNTDGELGPKPALPEGTSGPQHPPRPPRAGPDTGSSEVQVAILTTKILALAKQLETTSHKDKLNKRNLRLLVHRRQKLLKYLRRKERGGPRWQNLISTLGLTEATWKGEISM